MPTEMRDAYLEVIRAWVPPTIPPRFDDETSIVKYSEDFRKSVEGIGAQFVGRVLMRKVPEHSSDKNKLEVITVCDYRCVQTDDFDKDGREDVSRIGRSFSSRLLSDYLLLSSEELTPVQVAESQKVLAKAKDLQEQYLARKASRY